MLLQGGKNRNRKMQSKVNVVGYLGHLYYILKEFSTGLSKYLLTATRY